MSGAKTTEEGLPILTQRTMDCYAADFHNPERTNVPRVDMGTVMRIIKRAELTLQRFLKL